MAKSQDAYYWDSSALVKRYIIEEGSDLVAKHIERAGVHATSALSHAEILATFYRLRRDGNLASTNLERIEKSFLKDWSRLLVFPYSLSIQARALKIIKEVSLKGADLIQLATAEDVVEQFEGVRLIAFDDRLLNAAKDRGMKLLDS